MRTSLALCLLSLAFFLPANSLAQNDTTWVETYTWEAQNNPETNYDSPGRRWFDFPPSDNGVEYRKVLMYHNLKCFDQGTAGGLGYACGEWDYLSYNYLFDNTGVLDSTEYTHPQRKINNLNFDIDTLILLPTGGIPSDTIITEYSRVTNSFQGEYNSAAEIDVQSTAEIFTGSQSRRLQMLWTAEELLEMGLEPGIPIQDINLLADNLMSGFVTLRYQFTEATNISSPVLDGWLNLYEYHFFYEFGFTLGFSEDLVWDGELSLLLDMSLEDVPSVSCPATSAPGKVLAFDNNGGFVEFDGGDKIEVLASTLSGITDEVTIECWVNGNSDFLPANSTLFEGVNAQSQREVNVHLPWSNSRIYWDAGYDGGYDRIDREGAESEYEGVWTHWAFTKNSIANTMTIVRNGEVWHTGENKDNLFSEMTQMFIGSSAYDSNFYEGKVDEFRLWNVELGADVISDWMFETNLQDHPNISNLQASFDFDGPNGTSEAEAVESPYGGYYHGDAGRFEYSATELFQNPYAPGGDEFCFRPAFEFMQAETVDVIAEVEYILNYEAVEIPPVSIVEYQVEGDGVVATNFQFGWPHDRHILVKNQLGDTLDAYAIAGEQVEFENSTLYYYSEPFDIINRYELGRFITPYGINLTLGDDGWTWIYDVTDYLPLLRDSVDLQAGNWQELLDLKFAFIEGTPPRDVKNVEAFWNGTYQLNNWDDNVVTHDFVADEGEEMFKLVTRASGHWFGQGNNCAEFCYNTHSVNVNGMEQWSWEIMQECADNPLYPQGGTWIYDRAAWCPGAPVAQQQFELTPLVGNEFSVEYDITHDPYGNYRMEGQIISYGTPNMLHDVELMDILSPNNRKVLSRWNPVCEDPVVEIRNNGSEPLTSCEFSFGVEGEDSQTYTWTPEVPLEFLETAEVRLPYDAPPYTQGGDDDVLTFMVSVDLASGLDEENGNGLGYSSFERPPTWAYNDLDDNRIVVWTKTNNAPFETSIELRNRNEEVVWSRTYDTANTIYKDTLELNAGCYRFTVLDSGDDGLSFYWNNDGSGYVKFKKVAGASFLLLDDDFGKFISQAFRFETDLVIAVDEIVEDIANISSIRIFPNPTNNDVKVALDNITGDVQWELRNSMGAIVRQGVFSAGEGLLMNIEMCSLAHGVYGLSVQNRVSKSLSWIVKE